LEWAGTPTARAEARQSGIPRPDTGELFSSSAHFEQVAGRFERGPRIALSPDWTPVCPAPPRAPTPCRQENLRSLVGNSKLRGGGIMYNDYFGFKESPFSLSPNPSFFYANSVYREAYASLRYAAEAKKGFIAVTGEVGTGKTTLLRKLMGDLEKTTRSAFVFNTNLTFEELLRVILYDLGLSTASRDKLGLLEELNAYLVEQLKNGYVVCLLIDEAQNLSDESLEGLTLLSNFETNHEKLLQIVLMGQPELKEKLDRPHLRQLKQRIAIHCEITPLEAQEIGSYIDFRLRAAGYEGEDIFHPEAVRQIAFYSKGIPRLINALCDNALLIAFAASRRTVSADLIIEAARDLRLASDAEMIAPKNSAEPALSHGRDRAFAAEAARWTTRRNSRRKRRLGTGLFFALIVVVIGAALSDPQSLVTMAGRFLHLLAPQESSERPAEPGRETAPPKIQVEVASAEAKKTDAGSKPGSEHIVIQYGSTIYEIAIAKYGTHAVLGMDLIKEFNPTIINLNSVAAGQKLLVPALTLESLARRQEDGSYHLIVAAFLSRREADEFARRVFTAGYGATTTAKRVSNDLLLQRVEITGLNNLEEAGKTLETAVKRGWITR
jgi:type II secretory pathway predicted ATPase ExeA